MIVKHIHIEQVIFPAVNLAGLVEFSAGDSDIGVFCAAGDPDHFLCGNAKIVQVTQCRKEGENNRSRRRKTTDRQFSVDDAAHPDTERIFSPELDRRTAKIIRPVVLSGFGDGIHVKLASFFELKRLQFDDTVLPGIVRETDPFVDCQSGDLSELMIDVGTQRTDPVGCERGIRRGSFIDGFEFFDYRGHCDYIPEYE
jgi:hypothetical protein